MQNTSNKYTAVQNWLKNFRKAATTGDLCDPDIVTVIKVIVEYIMVHRNRMEIHLYAGRQLH